MSYLIRAVIAFCSSWILYFRYDIAHPWVCSANGLLNSNELFQFFRTFDVEGTEYSIIIHVIWGTRIAELVERLGYKMDCLETGVRLQAGERDFLVHNIKSGSGAHPGSYTVCTGDSFPESEAAGA